MCALISLLLSKAEVQQKKASTDGCKYSHDPILILSLLVVNMRFHLLACPASATILAAQMKQALAGLLKAIAGIAGLVFLLAPITDLGVVAMFIAAPVAVIAAVASSHLSDDEDNSNSGYWPKDPDSPS